jgi:AmiR/NasT family two-component response regulator
MQIDPAALAASRGQRATGVCRDRGQPARQRRRSSQGRLADQLHAALAHGAVIEQAKGTPMEREHLDAATAYERLRTAARSSNRKVANVARDLLAGAPFPPTQP